MITVPSIPGQPVDEIVACNTDGKLGQQPFDIPEELLDDEELELELLDDDEQQGQFE